MSKKIKKYKVGMDSETYAISLVESPAIEEEMVALEKQEPIKIQMSNDEKHMVYSAVLIPDKPIYRRNENGDEYYLEFTKESIEKMAYEFLKEYRQHEITVDHEDIAPEVTVVETWLKSDLYKDKSVALGLNEQLPIGTWFAGMKVNNVEIWERVKSGELKGFSVESMISLEDFNKIDKNDNDMENDMLFSKLTNWFTNFFKKQEDVDVNDEPSKVEHLEEETPVVEETPTVAEEPNNVVETPVEPSNDVGPITTPTEEKEEPVEPTVSENKPFEDVNHLEELVNSLKAEIEALKDMNTGLQDKIKDLGKQPSANPINVNAKPNANDTYSNWREQMAKYL